MVRCSYCDVELLAESDHVKCNGCDTHYCFSCSVKETTYRNMNQEKKQAWRCQYKCKGKPVSTKPQQIASIGLASDNETKALLTSLVSKMDGFETLLKDVRDSQTFMSDKYDELLSEVRDLKKQNKALNDMVVGLQRKVIDRDSEIESLKVQLNDLDQYGRRLNLEISGVEGAGKEDTMVLLDRLASKISVPFNRDNIQAAHPLRQNNPNYPPTIIVQFTSRAVRDDWIAQGRKAFKTTPPGPHKTYFNESLTPANRQLHRETRAKAKEKGYSFVWVKNGKILVRKDVSAPLIHIKSTKELSKI